MEASVRAERELEDIRRKMTSCMQQMSDFMRRVKVEKTEYLSNGKPIDVQSMPKANRALEIVARSFGMTISRMTSQDRQASIVAARQVAHYVIREATSLSTNEIADLTGLRHHTTVLHSLAKVEAMRKANPEFDGKVRSLISQVIGDDECPDEDQAEALTQ